MRSLDWKETAELIGIFAILASLIFVAMQLQQQEKMLNLELRNNLVANLISVNEQIIENPDIWIRGNSDEDLTATEFLIYENLLTNLNDYFFQLYNIFHELTPEHEEQILSTYAGFLARNPGAYRVWIERERQLHADRTAVDPGETITSDWIEMIDEKIAIIKSSQPRKDPSP